GLGVRVDTDAQPLEDAPGRLEVRGGQGAYLIGAVPEVEYGPRVGRGVVRQRGDPGQHIEVEARRRALGQGGAHHLGRVGVDLLRQVDTRSAHSRLPGDPEWL